MTQPELLGGLKAQTYAGAPLVLATPPVGHRAPGRGQAPPPPPSSGSSAARTAAGELPTAVTSR
jgi:hypothetical protein